MTKRYKKEHPLLVINSWVHNRVVKSRCLSNYRNSLERTVRPIELYETINYFFKFKFVEFFVNHFKLLLNFFRGPFKPIHAQRALIPHIHTCTQKFHKISVILFIKDETKSSIFIYFDVIITEETECDLKEARSHVSRFTYV